MSMSELIIILTIRRDRCSEPLIFSHNYRIKIPVPEYSTHAEPMLLAAKGHRLTLRFHQIQKFIVCLPVREDKYSPEM